MQDNEQLMLKALEAIKLNNPMQAAEYLEDILKDDPKNDKALVVAANLFEDPKKQLSYARKAVRANPENQEAKKLVKSLKVKIKKEKEITKTVQFWENLIPYFLALFGMIVVIACIVFYSANQMSEPTLVFDTTQNIPEESVEPILLSDHSVPINVYNQFSIQEKILHPQKLDQISLRAQTGSISPPSITANGQSVAFKHGEQIQVRSFSGADQSTWLVSRNWKGSPSNGDSTNPILSDYGRFVLFESTSTDFWRTGEGVDGKNLYLFDRQTDSLELISRSQSNKPLNVDIDESFSAALSANGQTIVYQATSSQIVPNDTNMASDIFVFNRRTQQTKRISINSGGVEGNGESINPNISGNGRYIVFSSNSTNLAGDNWHGYFQIYLHDLRTDETIRLAVDSRNADKPQISHDGTVIAYLTLNINRVEQNKNDLGIVVINRLKNERQVLFDNLGTNYGNQTPTISSAEIDLSPSGQFLIIGQASEALEEAFEGERIRRFFKYDLSNITVETFEVANGSQSEMIVSPRMSSDGESLIFAVSYPRGEQIRAIETLVFKPN